MNQIINLFDFDTVKLKSDLENGNYIANSNEISESNYKSFGLKGEYWSSTKVDEFAWVVQFTAVDNYNGYFCRALYNYYYGRPVRFCKKF